MKRITLSSLAGLTLLTVLATQGFAQTPNPNSAVVKTRIFNDCPFSTVTVVNNYPSLISIEDTGLACSGFANLHNWSFSEDGTTAAQFPNNSDFRVAADLTISGTGKGEAGLRLSPWWSPDVDGRFNVRTTDGEIACFGGRLPFYSFTSHYGLHYVKGDAIHLQMTYKPHGLNASSPATIEYELTYGGSSYASGELNFDQGNPSEDPPHGQWGLLNNGYVGGYIQPNMEPGVLTSGLKASFTNIRFVICPIEPDPSAAVIKTRVFNDCPPAAVTYVNNYPSQIQFTEAGLACSGFANLDVWTLADATGGGGQETIFNNDEDFAIAMDFNLSGKGEGGIRLSPWYSHDADGLFNVRSTDGEIACFGGRLPFYTFTGVYGLRYAMGTDIHLGLTYKHNGLSSTSPGTIQYDVVYNGTSYTSGPLNMDEANPSEDPPHGRWGILNDARVGGHMKAFMTPGDFSATTVGTFSNIAYSTGLTASVSVSPGSLNLKSNGNTVTAHLTPPGGYTPADFDVSTLRLNGSSGPIGTPTIEGNTLVVQFSRKSVQSAVQHDGGATTVTGDVGGICFTASSRVRTFAVTSPAAGSSVTSGSVAHLQWNVPQDLAASTVDVFATQDGGDTWSQIASSIANSGSYDWTVPNGHTRYGEIAVQTSDGVATGISGDFGIDASPVGVGDGGAVEFALKGVSPNPAKGDRMNIAFSLASSRQATLSLYDVSGRRVAFREVGVLGAGRHVVNLAQRLPAGMYVVRLLQDGRSLSARASVVR